MNSYLQNIQNLLQQNKQLTQQEREALVKAIADADRTTAILLEETVEELEQKRKAVEAQKRALEIEAALEGVRAVAMGMKAPEDMLEICRTISQQLELLNVKDIRNVQTAIIYESKGIYVNYEYYARHDKTFITEVNYGDPLQYAFINQMLKGAGEFFSHSLTGKELKDWYEYQKTTNVFIDNFLETASSLTYYWFSLGPVALGISTYSPLSEEDIDLFKRFRNVFELSYRRYIDIESALAQAREAQIEAALERVRSRTMAMQHSNELPQAANLLFQQIQGLGMPAWSAGYCIWDDDKQAITAWMSSEGVLQPPFKAPLTEDPSFIHMREAYEHGETFYVEQVGGEELVKHYQYMRRLPVVGTILDSIIEAGHPLPVFQIFHLAFFSQGFLLFITYEPVPEAHDIFKRFGKVFDQTYTRFLDLQKAEAQAREAQIQLALERVRARTMAMQRSNELADVATVLFQQVKALGIPQWVCGFSIWEPGDKEFTWYSANPVGNILRPCKVPLTEHPVFISFDESRRRGDELFVYEKEGEFQADHYRYMMTIPCMRELLENMLDAGLSFPTFQIDHVANFSHGNLVFITYEHFPEMHDVFKRFAKIFDQTYTRFLDLEKAEAQAREAQIEAALERVRSRSMAMHQSSDLHEVIKVVTEQLLGLGIKFNVANFARIFSEGSWDLWISTPEQAYPSLVHVPYIDHGIFNKLMEVIAKGGNFLADVYGQEEKNIFFKHFFENTSAKYATPEARKAYVMNSKGFARSIFLTKNIWLAVSNYDGIPFSDEENAIFKRFANSFEQSYTRFLDLQKAEAQAREAQIEAALERVRSSTMAMHKSEDLPQTAAVLFEQLRELGNTPDRISIGIIHEAAGTADMWLTDQSGNEIDSRFVLDLDEKTTIQKLVKAWKTGVKSTTVDLTGDELKTWLNYVRKIGLIVNDEHFKNRRVHNVAFFSHGWLNISTLEPLSADMMNVLERFATVYSLTYRRFLDLQKAEAQARESQIQLALERVRARTMAMQKSEELSETSFVLFQQLKELGDVAEQISIGIFNEEERVMDLFATIRGNQWVRPARPGIDTQTVMKKLYTAWKEQKKSLVLDLTGEALHDYNKFRMEANVGLYESATEFAQDRWVINAAFFSKGMLSFSTREPRTRETIQLLERFAGVFDLTYTRFLDLKQAEAQAREAEIELALERVRAKTMAMKKHDDLTGVIDLLAEQLLHLGFNLQVANFSNGISDKDWDLWIYAVFGDLKISTRVIFPWVDHPYFNRVKNAIDLHKAGGTDLSVEVFNKQEKDSWLDYVFTQTTFRELLPVELRKYHYETPGYCWSSILLKETWVAIGKYDTEPFTSEENNILRKFANAFGQAYTRFLDLQKAEVQAREAQIELALERVRAKTMAMQKPSEFVDVINVIGEQFVHLGFDIEWVNFGANGLNISEGIDIWNFAVIPGDQYHSGRLFIPFADHPVFTTAAAELDKYQKTRNDFFEITLNKDEKDGWLDHLYSQTIFKDTPDELKAVQYNKPGYTTSNIALKDTWLSIGKFDTTSFTDEQNAILRRFAKAFGLAYTRFLDLQKAETQARESQIQLALERVRARTMAMQHSDELSETAYILFQQFRNLGDVPIQITIGIFNEEKEEIEFRITGFDGSGSRVDQAYKMDIHEPVLLDRLYTAWKAQKRSVVVELTGKEMQGWVAYRNKISGRTEPFSTVKDEDRRFVSAAFFSKGLISFSKPEPIEKETTDILERFATVFDQTYTRFLDLQKAEAQAREAQIEAALEKVRSRSLAMHKSDELQEVVHAVFEKLRELNVDFYTVIIVIFQENSKDVIWWMENKVNQQYSRILIKYSDIPYLKDLFEAKENGKELFSKCYFSKEKNALYNYLLQDTDLKQAPEKQKQFLLESEFATVSVAFAKNTAIHITSYSKKSFSVEDNEILKRFARVFDQAYTRFLDLQKAEAQAREAQIQLALERVRARTMAMQRSSDLHNVIRVLTDQLSVLGFHFHTANFITNDSMPDWEIWISSPGVNGVPPRIHIPYIDHILFNQRNDAIAAGKDFLTASLNKEEKDSFLHYLFENTAAIATPAERKEWLYQQKGMALTTVLMRNISLSVINYDGILYTNEENEVIKRLTNVFEQSYRRFLDLQNAEAQARESQIQLALERVRARAMAMHRSDELSEVLTILFEQYDILEIDPVYVDLSVLDLASNTFTWRCTGKAGQRVFAEQVIDLDSMDIWKDAVEKWKSGETHQVVTLFFPKEVLPRAFELFSEIRSKIPSDAIFTEKDFPDGLYTTQGFCRFGALGFGHSRKATEEEKTIVAKFATEFERLYQRFLDLQKAEVQAHESQIEAALERVRSKAMAMHTSQDLADTIGVFYKELHSFSLTPIRCGVGLLDTEERVGELFTWNTTEEGQSLEMIGKLRMEGHPVLNGVYEHWVTQQEYHPVLRGNEIKEYYKVLRPQIDFPDYRHSDVQYGYFFFFPEGGVYAWTEKEMLEDELNIYRRFTSVLSLTYKRHKDLHKAEAQAREATIEAALERVRAKAMAMHSSNDLPLTAGMVFTELRKLGIKPMQCGVELLNKESNKAKLYAAASSADGDSLSVAGWVTLSGHTVLEDIYKNWLGNRDYYPELDGEQLKSYYELLPAGLRDIVTGLQIGQKQYGHFFTFSVGCLYAWSETPYNDAEIKILKRFATIIDLTFRRNIELQKSEANAREAVKQAALDSIRADIASMRAVSDLDRITPLIWHELTVLGIPFIRCGVFIMDDSSEQIHTFLSMPDGKAIGAFHLPYNTPGNIEKVLGNWRAKKGYIDHWDQSAFAEFAGTLVQQGALASPEEYLQAIPHEGFYLHFFPFLQGMLYVGNTVSLNEDEVNLIQAVADAFSTAYARYEDFKKLEDAKGQIEKTLAELKDTQRQLVQSEKMASLGELTAGIAHEIQNPLNFVNNFSEVNGELISELVNEVDKGNLDEARSIARDLKDNEEKINHHGKRADAIVKGMLLHSRQSTGVKELIDINALCDEYLRLSYHGLRAKNKSFNAAIKTDFDESVGRINVVPQDIGRVLLNLFNNAFYAVNEKFTANRSPLTADYKPIVSVQTKRINFPSGDGGVEIIVTDNGNGISPDIVDKIFQPFFTTKPTGQGTGLGLSLAYDIIKAHSGEIKVETKEDEGSEFVIRLPV